MKRKILNVLSVLFGLLLMNAGLSKFFNYMPVPENPPEAVVKDNPALAEISWLMPLIASAQVLGGLLILFPKTSALAAVQVVPVPENLPEAVVKDNAAFAEISWLMPLIASAELLGGLLILFPKTRALGALVVFPVMVGVLLTHTLVAPEGLPIALVIWAILLWIILDNKQKYLALIGQR